MRIFGAKIEVEDSVTANLESPEKLEVEILTSAVLKITKQVYLLLVRLSSVGGWVVNEYKYFLQNQ